LEKSERLRGGIHEKKKKTPLLKKFALTFGKNFRQPLL
jgi:hypothetical protein